MKTFLKIFLGLIVFLILGIAIFFLTFDLNSYKGMIVDAISKEIGRDVSIQSLDMKLSLIPTIKANEIKIQNPKGFESDKVFASVDKAEATLAIVPLFSKKIEIQDLSFGTTFLNLIEKNGKNNWTFSSSSPKKKSSGPVINRQGNVADEWLSQARVDNVTLKVLGLSFEKDGKNQNVSIMDLSLKQLKVFSLKAIYGSHHFTLSGTVNELLDLIKQKPDYLFNVDVAFSDLTAKVSGSIGDTKNFKKLLFNVELSGSNMRRAFAEFGVKNDTIPNQKFTISTVLQGDLSMFKIGNTALTIGDEAFKAEMLGQIWDMTSNPQIDLSGNVRLLNSSFGEIYGVKPFNAHFDTKVQDKVIKINSVTVSANRSDFQAKGRISFKQKKANLDLNLVSEYIDLNDVVPLDSSSSTTSNSVSQSKSAKLLPDKKIDLSFLKKIDADLYFDVPHIKVSNRFAGYFGVKGSLQLKDSVLNIKPLSATFLDGKIEGRAYVDARSDTQKIILDLKGSSLNLDLLKQLNKIVKGSTLDFSVDITTHGNSVQSFISHLNGKIIAEVPSGVIVNKWFNSLPANMGIFRSKTSPVSFSTSDQESHIVCGALNLNIVNGAVTSANNVAIETSTANFLIGGDIDLKTEELKLTMIPSLNNAKDSVNKALSAAQFVEITGTFSKPKASLNEKKVVSHIARSGLEQLIKSRLKKNNIEPERKEEQKVVPYLLCQRVLGRKTIKQMKKEALDREPRFKPVQPRKIREEPKQLTPQEEFKKQFMESLSEVLQ